MQSMELSEVHVDSLQRSLLTDVIAISCNHAIDRIQALEVVTHTPRWSRIDVVGTHSHL